MVANPPPSDPPPSPSHFREIIFGLVFLAAAVVIFAVELAPSQSAPAPAVTPAVAVATPVIASSSMPTLPLTYPASRRTHDSDVYFGTKVEDPYRWLEDGKSPEVKSWLDAQNHLARSYLDALPGRQALRQRYEQLFHVETISAPGRRGDRVFYTKRRPDDEKSILYWRSLTDASGAEHVLIDPNLYTGANNASLGSAAATYDGKLVAYSLRPNNADEATLYVREVGTGKDLPGEVITGAKYADPSWMPDNSGFVYTYLPPADPSAVQDRPGLAVVKYHRLGTDPKTDPVLHAKTGDATKFIGADISRDGKWIFFNQQNGWDKNDVYYQPLHGEPTAELAKSWRPIVVGKPFLYSLEAWEGQAYILTNEKAPRYRLFKVALASPSRSKWREIIPQSPTLVLQGTAIIGQKLVLNQLENVTSKLEIRDLEGKAHPTG